MINPNSLFYCLMAFVVANAGKRSLLFSTMNAGNSTPEVLSASIAEDQGDSIALDSLGYGCQAYYDGPKRIKKTLQLEIKSLSYDVSSKKLLIQTTTRDENRFTLLLGDPCQSNFQGRFCQDLIEERGSIREVFKDSTESEHRDHRSLKTLYREAKSPDSSRVGPFAIFDGQIFFVLQRIHTSDFKSKTNLVQIRELTSRCFDIPLEYPIFATDSVFDLMECSVLVTEVVYETFTHFHRFRPLDVLLVTSSKYGLDIFLQILEIYSDPQNSTASEDVKTIAHLYRTSNSTNTVEIVHSVTMTLNYVKYFLLQLGGMSYKDEFLCWAPLDRILCGLWTGGKMSRLRTHLPANDAKNVCTASSNNPGLGHIISGLAISSASIGGEISLHFGCVAQVPGMGGFGFLRAPERGGAPIQLSRVSYNNSMPIFAGSLVLTDRCDEYSSAAIICLPCLFCIGVWWTSFCAYLVL